LDGGNFYEYTVRVRIDDVYIGGKNKHHVYMPGESYADMIARYKKTFDAGVNFRLSAGSEMFDGGFEHFLAEDILKGTALDHQGYAELKFYIRPDVQSDLSLVIEFGNEDMAVTADVFIKDLALRSILESEFLDAEAAYNAAKKAKDTSKYMHVSIIKESYKPPAEKPERGGLRVDWWYVVPTIIMAAAVLIALAGFLLRKYKFKVHIQKHHTSYASDDRSTRRGK